MSESDKDWGFSLQHPDNAPRASGRANEGRQAVNTDEWPAVARNAYALGAADERARCIKVLEALRDSSQHSGAEWIAYRFAITALSEAATPPPVASSPVGGEQR
jgi:hypothetical protein